MASGLFSKVKRWFRKPQNQQKAKRAARSAYQKYKGKNKP